MNPETFSLGEKLHYYHRFLRYWWRTEPDTVRFIKEEFDRGGFALDIGANKGIVTYFLGKQAGPDGKVIAFEPQPEMRAQIEKVINTFDLKNVEIHSVALSNTNEKATLFRGKPGATANLVAGGSWQTDEVEVETRTLDSYISEAGLEKIDFVKCDVDGYETQVLEGAEKLLTQYSPKVLVEISEPLVPRIEEILKKYGYDQAEFWYKGERYPIEKTKEIGYRHPNAKWRNFLFTKSKS